MVLRIMLMLSFFMLSLARVENNGDKSWMESFVHMTSADSETQEEEEEEGDLVVV